MASLPAFVSTQWLEKHLGDEKVRIVHVGGENIYPQIHLPKAVLLPMGAILVMKGGVPGMMADPAHLEQIFSQLGIDAETHVVAYDATGGLDAARLIWTLARLGHMKGSVLDGGLGAWYEEQRPMTQEVPEIAQTTFHSEPVAGKKFVVTLEQMQGASKGEEDVALVDTRSENEYAGRNLMGLRGHIPGARHRDWISTLKGPKNPRLQSDSALRALYADAGVSNMEKPVFVYCQTAHRASQSWLLLRHLGFKDVRLYDGSMAEWGLRGMPLETEV
ncbi:MAG: sulfurtransferase [Magnetococcales bacterium]|nr:sulfurtransferase [Magnetococcales bacterium]